VTCGKNSEPITGITNTATGFNMSEMMLSPNPANNALNISVAAAKSGAYHVEVTDVEGRIVLSSVVQLSSMGARLDIAGLKQGYYLLKLRNSESQWAKPFMKK
jgi:hypothetical protein